MTRSYSRAMADDTASKMTAAGSDPSSCRTSGTPARSAQTPSCSAAAARKVSPAASSTFLPCARYRFASLPIDVVLPTPFTPITRITAGLPCGAKGPSAERVSTKMAFNASSASLPVFKCSAFTRSFSFATRSSATSSPVSASTSCSTNSS
ncbi:hypothetical protein SDC9_144457 [bioreactor metagenome]|uniref:Uncharacterized protein n=1 Tax=bioreactor metagenome TaxID=1076179 RepID=A0A645E655_9ZZZZ